MTNNYSMANLVPVDSPNNELSTGTALQRLTPEQLERANQIASRIDIHDPRSLMTYGSDTQRKLEQASDQVLGNATGRDNEEIAQVITTLMQTVNEVMPDDVEKARKGGLFPWARKKIEQRMLNLQVKARSIEGSIATFSGRLRSQNDKLIKNNVILKQQMETLKNYFQDLNVEIAAGEIKLQEIDEKIMPELLEKKSATNDPFVAQELMQIQQARSDLASHLDSLTRSQQLALLQAGQILVLQQGNSELSKKLDEAVTQVVPLWKSQMTMTLMLLGAENALKTLDVVTDTTNKLITSVSKQVKSTGIEIAKKSKESIIKMETLRDTHRNLMETIQGITEVTKDAEQKRLQAQAEISKNQDELIALLRDDHKSGALYLGSSY